NHRARDVALLSRERSMARFAVVFRSLRLGFEVKPLPRARAEYSLLIVICGGSVVNGERIHLACCAWDPAKHSSSSGKMPNDARWKDALPTRRLRAAARVFRLTDPARERSRACLRCALCRQNVDRFSFAQSDKNNLQPREFHRPVYPDLTAIVRNSMPR